MKHSEIKKLPDAELEIMKVVWHNETPIATSEIKRIIDAEGANQWTQSTMQTLINRLIGKGFLDKGKRGKEYIYTALVSETEYIRLEKEIFLKKMHGNSVISFMRALLDSRKISDADIDELEKLFKEKRND